MRHTTRASVATLLLSAILVAACSDEEQTEPLPDTAVPVIKTDIDLGPGRTAIDVSIGSGFSRAILDDGSVKCWGSWGGGAYGATGRGNMTTIGDGLDTQLLGPKPQRDARPGSSTVRHDPGDRRCRRRDGGEPHPHAIAVSAALTLLGRIGLSEAQTVSGDASTAFSTSGEDACLGVFGGTGADGQGEG